MEEYEARKEAGDLSSDPDDDDEDEDNHGISIEEELWTYDPEILSDEDAEWTYEVQCLGRNADIPGPRKCFITGPATFYEYGAFVVDRGNDPNFAVIRGSRVTAYWDQDGGRFVFPFHPCCYEILALCMTGTRDAFKLDKDHLFGVMEGMRTEFCSRLELDYGKPDPPKEQFWSSIPGDEIFAKAPVEDEALVPLIRSIISDAKFQLPGSGKAGAIQRSSSSGVFSNLPYDIIFSIAEFLPASSIVALSQASWTLQRLLGGNSEVWRRCLLRELVWFYELVQLVQESGRGPRLNFRMVMDWADKVTEPRLNMRGPFLGVANRRRIWRICERLAELCDAAARKST